jgi:hypothetical protein
MEFLAGNRFSTEPELRFFINIYCICIIHDLDIIEGINFLSAEVFLNALDSEYASGKIYNSNREHTIDNNNGIV